ncbi:cysteine desulfurase-like protein [Nocardioides psychrotolerans]|uniref:Cysteine desulfurase family protein, VC1184 subfamily n=1 Tax=Nocardioides psychrotolerans TaxID=1005945 RepID=A0A1I3ILR0_9ACTN|nr:cysteine desulfurase-like protein [Nocardioides psychrotolerans]GEP38059.1 cysteine desulfurase-like protein [Nocardioides psychrotolerans]SFI48935.1 cysteine desulfurase family protein, VC1184 subfamily [Nocardioides psychrotolerans]
MGAPLLDPQLDVGRIRSHFPALDQGVAHFDGPGGSQVPLVVAQAVADAMTSGLCQRGTLTASERRTDSVTVGARQSIADLVGGDPGGVVFGRSMTQLTMDLARTLAQGWGPGDEVVVTRLDHDANIRPWVIAAERAGATVRWLGFDPVTTDLDDVTPLLCERTRLVALTGASNLFGTRPDVAAVAAAAHAVGALVFVDAVHLTPHAPVDLVDLGADVLVCSPYKFFGPHLGALVASPSLLEGLRPDKLLPSSDAVPERFELGTLPYELLAGVTAAVDFIADLVPGQGSRRERVLVSMATLEQHEDVLLRHLLDGLAGIDGVSLHGRPARRTPTVLFTVAGHAPRAVHEHLGGLSVNAPASHFYALEASRHAGLGDEGGVRVGLAAYTTQDEVDRLLDGVRALLG